MQEGHRMAQGEEEQDLDSRIAAESVRMERV